MRRCGSTPTFCSVSSDGDSSSMLEVYVAMRALQQKLPYIPESMQNGLLRDIGCAHYYTVLRQPSDGSLRALDFGPSGGRDIAFENRQQASLWSWARNRRSKPQPRGTPGEIRELMLTEMPKSCMFVGRTSLSLKDIRSFNNLQEQLYLLHKNDCRHYVNKLVQYATGAQNITRMATRQIYTAKRKALAWSDRLVLLTHRVTDVGTWPRVQRASQAALAVLAALGGRRAAAKLGWARPPALLIPPRIAQAAAPAAAAQPARMALVRSVAMRPPPRRVYAGVTAAATATYAASLAEVSLLARVGDTFKSATTGTGSYLRSAGARAGQLTVSGVGRVTSAAAAAVGLSAIRPGGPQVPLALPCSCRPLQARRQRNCKALVVA